MKSRPTAGQIREGKIMATLSSRQRAWRNIMVAATNAALERELFKYPPTSDEPAQEGAVFDFELAGFPCVGYVRDAGFDEIAVHAFVDPPENMRDHVRCGNLEVWRREAKIVAAARGWIERRTSFHLQTNFRKQGRMPAAMSCAKAEIQRLASVEIKPDGYADKGRWHM